MSQIMELLNKSKNWVMKWFVRNKTGDFSEEAILTTAKVKTTGSDVMMTSLPVEAPSGG